MAHDVKDAFPRISSPTAVYPREPILAGDDPASPADNPSHIAGALQADRRSNAMAVPVVLSVANPTGESFPGASWATLVERAPFTTRAGTRGDLRVTVECRNCLSSGGVEVTVLDSGGSSVVAVTLQNSTGSTDENLMDDSTLTGLSGETSYFLKVRARGNGTTALVYALLVEEVEHRAASLA